MSNVGLWEGWHTTVKPFGDTPSYALGAEWLKDCALIEDWGAGSGFFSTLVPPERYRGIDGSPGPRTSIIVDLVEYRSEVPGIYIRHVLEHAYGWTEILNNALASFTERMFLVLFTPLSEETHDTEWEDPPGVPNLSFALSDLVDPIIDSGAVADIQKLGNAIPYGLREPKQVGTETVFRISR